MQVQCAQAPGDDVDVQRVEQAKQELLPLMRCPLRQTPDACIQQSAFSHRNRWWRVHDRRPSRHSCQIKEAGSAGLS